MRTPWMKQPLWALCCTIFLCLTAQAIPAKQTAQLIDYHDSGRYYQDLSAMIKKATCYLQFRLTQNARSRTPKKLAMVFDIDETLLSNFNNLSAHDFDPRTLARPWHTSSVLAHSLALYNFARDHHVAIFLLTTRPATAIAATTRQLHQLGYSDWAALLGVPATSTPLDYHYFQQARQHITAQGYDILLNIGTQPLTLVGGGADMTLRLPNPFYRLG